MPVQPVTQFLTMRDMIVCDSRNQIYISKPFDPNEEDTIPEFGQPVKLLAAVASGETTINVRPLIENLAVGRTLDFGGTSVTVAAPAAKNATEVTINAAGGAIAAGTVATTGGVEQVLTLGSAVTAGDNIITVSSGLTFWVEKGRWLNFGGLKVKTLLDTAAGETEIQIDDAKYPIAAGTTASLPYYDRILSANQADDSSNANTLNERNFESGKGTAKHVTSYNDTISVSGNYIKDDFGLFRLYNIKEDPNYWSYLVNAIVVEAQGGRNLSGIVHLGQHGNQRPNDQTKKISLTLEVDGLLIEAAYPVF